MRFLVVALFLSGSCALAQEQEENWFQEGKVQVQPAEKVEAPSSHSI